MMYCSTFYSQKYMDTPFADHPLLSKLLFELACPYIFGHVVYISSQYSHLSKSKFRKCAIQMLCRLNM